MTSITYVTKFQGIFISKKMTLSDDKQDPLTCSTQVTRWNSNIMKIWQHMEIEPIKTPENKERGQRYVFYNYRVYLDMSLRFVAVCSSSLPLCLAGI